MTFLSELPEVAGYYSKSNPLPLESIKVKSNRKVLWECPQGHVFENIVFAFVAKKNKCDKCAGKIAVPGLTDAQSLFPELEIFWSSENTLSYSEVNPLSSKPGIFNCEFGHVFNRKINRFIIENIRSCPVCKNVKCCTGVNDFKTTHPRLANRIKAPHDEVKKVTQKSSKKFDVACLKFPHTFKASPKELLAGKNCTVCLNRIVTAGVNDLVSTLPEVLKHWDYKKNSVSPNETSTSNKKLYYWVCQKGHSYKADAKSVAYDRYKGCYFCSYKKFSAGVNCLLDEHPEFLEEWLSEKNIGVKVTELRHTDRNKYWWKCEKRGHQYLMSPREKFVNGRSCPTCTVRETFAGKNGEQSLLSHEIGKYWCPEKNKELKLELEDITPGSAVEVWRCATCASAFLKSPNIVSRFYEVTCDACREKSNALEKSVKDYIKEKLPEFLFQENVRNVIRPKELDILFQELAKAIEVNGDYWHSNERMSDKANGSAKEYHSGKRALAKNKGVSLVFVWEHDWVKHRKKVECALLAWLTEDVSSPILDKLEGVLDEECFLCE